MKHFAKIITLLYIGISSLYANDTLSTPRLNTFYHLFMSDQKEKLDQAGIGDGTSTNVGTAPLPPAPKSGMLPIVITNTTGLPASEVYVTLAGQQVAAGTQFFSP